MTFDIAWLSPWNDRSAIATFSVHLITELRQRGNRVTVFRSEIGHARSLPPPALDIVVEPLETISHEHLRQNFDHVVANIGNHFPYHGALPRVLNYLPCLGIFHDGFLAHLAAPWAESRSGSSNAAALLASLLYNDDSLTYAPYWAQLGQMAAERPMLEWLAGMVAGAVTHSHHWADRLQAACPGSVTVHPLSMPDDHMPPPPPWNGRLVLATIGDVNRNKQADQVLHALAGHAKLRERCDYRLLGVVEEVEQQRLTNLALSLGLRPPSFSGWLTNDALRAAVGDVHVICCLRYPLLEAGSASLITGMRSARPVLVSDHGCYAEVPRHLVLHCEPGNEAPSIMRHLLTLLDNPERAVQLGEEARIHSLTANSAASYVDALIPAMEAATAVSPIIAAARELGRHLGEMGVAPHDPPAARIAQALAPMFPRDDKDITL